MRKRSRRVLFIQATEAGGYPPIVHACTLMASDGWEAMVLNAPIAGYGPVLPPHPRVTIRNMPPRLSHVMGKKNYVRYVIAASRAAAEFQPDVVYASDPTGAAPGLAAAKLAHASLIYHEHDTPNPGALNRHIARFRRAAARKARVVIFPNAARAGIAQGELGFRDEQLRIVWNLPRRSELPSLSRERDSDFVVYYHGSITPDRFPLSVVDAVAAVQPSAKLWIMGFETPGAGGYLARLLEYGRRERANLVEYFGQVPTRASLFERASQASVGLALMPRNTTDLNMKHMTGASNKGFDYMASGLALLVSDLPDWVDEFVRPGYARACNPDDAESIAAELSWLAANPLERRTMGAKGRDRIEAEWNYETSFTPVLRALDERLLCAA